MLNKPLILFLVHFCITEGIIAQDSGSGLNGGEVFINNPNAESDVHTSVSTNPTQALSTTDPVGKSNVIASSPPNPEPIASFPNPEDLARLARGALNSGFEDSGVPSNLMGGAIPTVITDGVGGLPGMAEGKFIGSAIGSQPIGLVGPSEAINVSGYTPNEPALGLQRGPVNPGLAAGMLEAPVTTGLFNTPVIKSRAFPVVPATIPSNTVLFNGIASGLTSPVYQELTQATVYNGLVNPVAAGTNVYSLSNAGLPNTILQNPTITGRINGLTTAMTPNIIPAAFPDRTFSQSKSILASLTGIDPASLRTNAKFTVKSSSPISPTGLTVQADNLLMQGKLAITGKMPFLGSVTVDGVVPDGGIGTVMYECGNGNIGMISEGNTAPVGSFGRAGVTPVNHVNGGFNNAVPNILGLRNSVF